MDEMCTVLAPSGLCISEVPEKRIKILYCPEREGGLRGESKGPGVQFWIGPFAVGVIKSSYSTDGWVWPQRYLPVW